MKTFLVVTTTPWHTDRTPMVDRLRRELHAQCEDHNVGHYFHVGTDRDSHITNYWNAIRVALHRARDRGDTHITLLPDDAILVPHFVEVLQRLVEQRPDDHLCLVSNHPGAPKLGNDVPGYYTIGGSLLFGGTMRVDDWRAYLDWREEALNPEAMVPFDHGVNLWHVLQGTRCFKPLPSLCEHDTTLESTLGNEWQEKDPAQRVLRHSQVWQPEADLRGRDWRGDAPDIGRTFKGQHWDLVRALKPSHWDVEAMYRAERHGAPVSASPHVMIAVPLFGEPAQILGKTEPSRRAVADHLTDHGISVTIMQTPGDSLVQRMRQRVMHEFLKSPATHLLWWDADIECLTPECVAQMVAQDKGIIAGAYPFKDTTRRVVCNLIEEHLLSGSVKVVGGCLEAQDAGTGFMLVRRDVHVRLAEAHPELMHLSLSHDDRDEPMWALYDTMLDRQRLLSEDYAICRLWQRLGEKVYVYLPARFKHWGLHGFEGSLEEHFGMERKAG